jgi:hypothetical protein
MEKGGENMANTSITVDFDAITEELLELLADDNLTEDDTYELDSLIRGLEQVDRLVSQPELRKLISGFSIVSAKVQSEMDSADS